MGIGSVVGLNPAIAHSSINQSPPLLLAQSPSPKGIEELPLQVGSQGETVQALQTRLQKLGYYEGDTDGIYGGSTRLAVIAFQESIDLNPDGVVGLTTWTRLQAAAAEVPESDPNDSEEAENAEGDENTEPNQSNNQRKPLLWILAGLSVTVIIFGGFVFFLLKIIDNPKKRQASAKNEESPPPSPSEESETPRVTASSNGLDSSPPESIHPPSPPSEPYTNGYNPSALSLTDSHLAASPSSAELSPSHSLTKPKSRLARKNGVNQLIKDLQDSDSAKRRKAIWELAQRGDSRAVQPLVNLMLESDSQQRSLIVEALSQIGMKTLKPMNRALALSLQDGNPQVRKNAIRDVTLMYELVAQISQLLSYALDDPEADVQETARWALSQLERIRTPVTMNSLPSANSPLSFSENQRQEPPLFE